MYASIVFYQIVIMLILAGIGLVYQKVHPLSEHDVSVVSRIIAMVLSSGLILSGGAQDYSGLTTANCIAAAIVGFATYLSLMVIGYLLGRVLTKDRGRRIIYSMLCAFGNVGFFGIPLVNAAYMIPEEKRIEKMRIVSVAPLFAEAMTRIFTNGSISKLFD